MPSKKPSLLEMSKKVSADKLLKTVFELFLKDLVEILNPKLAARLKLDNPTFLPRELFADFRKMGHRAPDVAAEVAYLGGKPLGGKPQALTVHVEAEDRFRKVMDTRMAEYSMLFYLTTKKIVFPACVFLKGGRKPGVEVREVELSSEGWLMGRFYYAALYLGKNMAEDWVDRPQDLAPALAALMPSRAWDKVEHKLRCLGRISHSDLDLRRQYVLGKVVDKYLELDDNEEKRFTVELERKANKEIRAMAVTWEEALAERETEGRVEGRIEAIQDAVLLLADRFWSEVPDEFAERIRLIRDINRLHAILERIPRVRSAAELDLD